MTLLTAPDPRARKTVQRPGPDAAPAAVSALTCLAVHVCICFSTLLKQHPTPGPGKLCSVPVPMAMRRRRRSQLSRVSLCMYVYVSRSSCAMSHVRVRPLGLGAWWRGGQRTHGAGGRWAATPRETDARGAHDATGREGRGGTCTAVTTTLSTITGTGRSGRTAEKSRSQLSHIHSPLGLDHVRTRCPPLELSQIP